MGGRAQLSVGDRATDFVLVGPSGVRARFYAHAGGRPTAVVFDGTGDDPRLIDLADRLAMRGDVAVCCVTSRASVTATGTPMWSDPEGRVAEAYGVTAGGAGTGDAAAPRHRRELPGAAHTHVGGGRQHRDRRGEPVRRRP